MRSLLEKLVERGPAWFLAGAKEGGYNARSHEAADRTTSTRTNRGRTTGARATGAQAGAAGLLRSGVWHDDRRGLAGADGRLAGPRRSAGGDAGVCDWRRAAAAGGVGVRRMGEAAAGRFGRSGIHGAGVSADRELFHGVD